MNHLSYVGDATIGIEGQRRCRHDHVQLRRCEQAPDRNRFDGAFIGSGVMLIAPVEVGDSATIGAGSAISKDAPAGELTLARARQVTVPGWQRPKKAQ